MACTPSHAHADTQIRTDSRRLKACECTSADGDGGGDGVHAVRGRCYAADCIYAGDDNEYDVMLDFSVMLMMPMVVKATVYLQLCLSAKHAYSCY